MVKHKAHGLLDVFPKRPNQKVVNGQDLLNTPRSTRSAGSKNLFTMCPYANTIVAYDSTNSEPKTRKTRNSYSPDPRNNTAIALVGSSSSNNTTSKPARSKSVMPKTGAQRPRAQAPASRSPSRALPSRADASGSSILNGNSPNDGNITSTNDSHKRAVSVAAIESPLPKGLKMAAQKRYRSRAPAPGVLATLTQTPEPAPADVPGPSSPHRRALDSTINTTVRNSPEKQMADPVFPSTSAIPKGLKVIGSRRPRSRGATSKMTPISIVVSPPVTTSTATKSSSADSDKGVEEQSRHVSTAAVISSAPGEFEKVVAPKRSRSRAPRQTTFGRSPPDCKNRNMENDSDLLRCSPSAPISSNTLKDFGKVDAPKHPLSRDPSPKASSSSETSSSGDVRASIKLKRSPPHRRKSNIEDTPKPFKNAPNTPMTSNTSNESEKGIARKRPRSGGPPPRVSTSSATIPSSATASSNPCTSDPPSKVAKVEIATTSTTSPAGTVDLASSEPAAKHFLSASMKSPASVVVKVARKSTLNQQDPITPQIDALAPSLTSSPIPVKTIVETQSPVPGKGPLSVPSPKPQQALGARALSVAPQRSNQSPGRPVRAASVAVKKVANVAPKATRKRVAKGNNQRRRDATPPPDIREIGQNENSPLVPRPMVFFPLNPALNALKKTAFKALHYTPKYARRITRAEETKGCSAVAEDVASLYKRQYCPLFVFGKLAIQYENFDFTDPCRFIKNLACFHEEHENLLIPILKLGDWEKIKNLNEGNVEAFYKNEMVPAIENFRKFNEDPTGFYDVHKGQYEMHWEDNVIIEYPLPPRPEVFPSQIRQRMSLDMYNEVNRRSEARARREVHAAARAHDAAIAAAMETQRLAAAAAAEIPMMHIHNHLDNLAAYHHQQMMNQMFMPQPFFYQPPPPPTPPMFPHPPNNMFYPGMHFQPQPMPFDAYFNNGFPMHEFNLQ